MSELAIDLQGSSGFKTGELTLTGGVTFDIVKIKGATSFQMFLDDGSKFTIREPGGSDIPVDPVLGKDTFGLSFLSPVEYTIEVNSATAAKLLKVIAWR